MWCRIRACAIVCLAAAAHGARAQTPPAAVTPLLRIDVVAVDRSGHHVTDLKREDVEVWIGPYRVPIETVTHVTSAGEGDGRHVVLLLDDLTIDPSMAPRVKEVARRFITRMAPGDRIGIVTLNGDVSEATGDATRLRRTVDEYNGYSGGVVRLEDVGAQFLNMLTVLSRQMLEVPGRKAIVAIGAAWLFDTPIPPPALSRDLRAEWTAAVRTMAAARTSLYVIDPGGLGPARFLNPTSGFARDTGGHAFVNTNDLNGAADQIMRDTSNYYVIEVGDPPVGRRAELRDLDVRVLRRGVTLRVRRALPGR